MQDKRFTPYARDRCAETVCAVGITAVHPHMRGADERDGRVVVLLKRFTPTCVGQMNGAR